MRQPPHFAPFSLPAPKPARVLLNIVDDDDIMRQSHPGSLACVHASCDVAAARGCLIQVKHPLCSE